MKIYTTEYDFNRPMMRSITVPTKFDTYFVDEYIAQINPTEGEQYSDI